MFEVYAVIASVLLPTGIISFIYFIYHMKSSISNPILWTLIFESITTVLLGVFYMYSAIILSGNSVTNEVILVDNNIDDLAIINDTAYGEIEVPTFTQIEELPSDQNNEIEDTRNNKNKGTPSQYLQTYQNLVQTSIRKKLQNGTREEKSLYRIMLQYARNLKEEVIPDIVENKNCFLRMFFYQALLVYSFVTSALSLLSTCQICQQCANEDPTKTTSMKPTKSENPSESFGEKISDDVSDDSSQNAAPVGPLFDNDSIGSSTPNLEVFSVKKSSQAQLTTQQQPDTCSSQVLNSQQEKPVLTAGKCVTILVLPILLVVILYFLMKTSIEVKASETDNINYNFLSNLNTTNPDIQTANFVKNFNDIEENNTRLKEINNILRNVYSVINKFEEEHKYTKMPTASGQYLFKSKFYKFTSNSTEECVGDETNLKTFDFIVFVLLFFAVIFYTKLTEVKLPKNSPGQNINKCIIAFLVLWGPGIIDMVVSRFLTSKEPTIFSTLLLLLGNMDRLLSTKQNVSLYKMYGAYGKMNAFVNPVPK